MGWNFDNSYARLPDRFFARVAPTPVPKPSLVVRNAPLANALGLDVESLDAPLLVGHALPSGAQPIAQAYAGHQFGGFTVLGDGRAILLGEQQTPAGLRFDVQLKGAGPTPFSRRGDGRAALGPMLREYIVSEAMHALGLPTTRSLGVATTGAPVYREEILKGAVLTRIASSHLRVGTFQLFAARRDAEGLRVLADYAIARHDPALAGEYAEWLRAIVRRQAQLIARWMHVGFVHGVMNTDNMTLSGETIDYGPCAFLDTYDPTAVFSSIDEGGRYAYGNQPRIGLWNLARFAEAILALLHPDEDKAIGIAEEILGGYARAYDQAWLTGMREKLGLFDAEEPADAALVADWLAWMDRTHADFTRTFRSLSTGTDRVGEPEWQTRWSDRVAHQPGGLASVRERMRLRNPAVIPRNHVVERALAAANDGDLSVLERLLAAVTRPFDELDGFEEFRAAPPPGAGPYVTFCGT